MARPQTEGTSWVRGSWKYYSFGIEPPGPGSTCEFVVFPTDPVTPMTCLPTPILLPQVVTKDRLPPRMSCPPGSGAPFPPFHYRHGLCLLTVVGFHCCYWLIFTGVCLGSQAKLYHFTPIRMAITKTTKTATNRKQVSVRRWRLEASCVAGGDVKWCSRCGSSLHTHHRWTSAFTGPWAAHT